MHSLGLLAISLRRGIVTLFANPALEQSHCIVPQCVNLNGLAAARSNDPVADFGVHPGELVAFSSLVQQSITRIGFDVEARPREMMIDDVNQMRQQQPQRSAIMGEVEIALYRVKEPERGVGGVI